MSTPDPAAPPPNFGIAYVFRYGLWWIYTSPLTLLFTAQLILQQLAYDPANAQAPWVHWALTGANCLGIIAAQIRRTSSLPPPPTKAAP